MDGYYGLLEIFALQQKRSNPGDGCTKALAWRHPIAGWKILPLKGHGDGDDPTRCFASKRRSMIERNEPTI